MKCRVSVVVPLLAVLACLAVTGAGRKPATRPATAPAAPAELQGVWEFVGPADDGTGGQLSRGARAVITADAITVNDPRGRGPGLRFAYRVDPAADPKQIDWTVEHMPGKPVKQAGIYAFDVRSLTLRICMAAPDQPRPATFIPKQGEAAIVWRLHKLKGDGNGKAG